MQAMRHGYDPRNPTVPLPPLRGGLGGRNMTAIDVDKIIEDKISVLNARILDLRDLQDSIKAAGEK